MSMTDVVGEEIVERVARDAYRWLREMEELGVDTGVRADAGGISIGLSGVTWESFGALRQAELTRRVANELAGEPAALGTRDRVFQAFVYAVGVIYCADRDALKRVGRDWLRRHTL